MIELLQENWYFIAGGVAALTAGIPGYFVLKSRSSSVDTDTDADTTSAPSSDTGAIDNVITDLTIADTPTDVDETDTDVDQTVTVPDLDRPDPDLGRLARLRARLVKSNNAIGKGLLSLLSQDTIDDSTWEEVEETLLIADLGMQPAAELLDNLRQQVTVLGTRNPQTVKTMLADELLKLVDPHMNRELSIDTAVGRPAVVMVVGVNGVGKTTTVGKLARVLVSQDRDVLLGAADTFRAAAADQLDTWGSRVGAPVIRSDKDGGDPAAVAFDAVSEGMEAEVDVVLLDTAGRLQNKIGLMDELGKVKRVAEKALAVGGKTEADLDEVLLVLDATTGQNGMRQAQVFAEAVNVTGIVLTKLDGTAKGGIVVAVQRELGVPVKFVGLGEGPDDLAPFDPEQFVDALLED